MKPTNDYSGLTGGCDPGRRTGFVVWDDDHQKIIEITTVSIDQTFIYLNHLRECGLTVLGVEHNPSTHVYARAGVSMRGMLKIAQNIERNRAYARQIVAYAKSIGLRVLLVVPGRTKPSKELMEEATGYTGRSSSHSRDAWLIAMKTHSILRQEEQEQDD